MWVSFEKEKQKIETIIVRCEIINKCSSSTCLFIFLVAKSVLNINISYFSRNNNYFFCWRYFSNNLIILKSLDRMSSQAYLNNSRMYLMKKLAPVRKWCTNQFVCVLLVLFNATIFYFSNNIGTFVNISNLLLSLLLLGLWL